MTENLIDRAWDVFERVQKQHGAPSPDEVSFVGGFTACFGILVGKVDIGLDQNAPLDQHLDLIHRSLTNSPAASLRTRPSRTAISISSWQKCAAVSA
jgi:hypothetical protein